MSEDRAKESRETAVAYANAELAVYESPRFLVLFRLEWSEGALEVTLVATLIKLR